MTNNMAANAEAYKTLFSTYDSVNHAFILVDKDMQLNKVDAFTDLIVDQV